MVQDANCDQAHVLDVYAVVPSLCERGGGAMKGRIVVCKEYGKPFEIDEYDVPTPESGAVLLRMTQAGICGSDLHVWRGDQVNVPLPPTGRVLGHEGTGGLAQLGSSITTETLCAPIHEGVLGLYTQ